MANQEEAKIPVFSVVKNGVTLKNIILNNPRWEDPKPSSDLCDPLLIGRHPDCHIVLDHPSISRFHLELRANPNSTTLSLLDLGSVHGTWVSGVKIQPNSAVHLIEGDTLKLGSSTRVYELHWLPLRTAYEIDKPLSPLPEEAPPQPTSQFLDSFSSNECISPLASEKKEGDKPASLLSRRSKSKSVSSLSIQTGRNRDNVAAREAALCRVLFASENAEEASEVFVSVKENTTPLISRDPSLTPVVPSRHRLRESVGELQISPYSDKENWTPEASKGLKPKKLIHGDCLQIGEEEENEAFVSDKENMTPMASSGAKKPKKKTATDSEARIEREITERRRERIPLQSLLKILSPQERTPFKPPSCNRMASLPQSLLENNESVQDKKKWIMVVDTDCLLNEESRRSLRLLEGLRGTQLIIPRIGNFVIFWFS